MKNNELWEEIEKMFSQSKRDVRIIEGTENVGLGVITYIGLNDDTSIGAVIRNTKGIIVDNTVRILGQGDKEIDGMDVVNEIEDGRMLIDGKLIVATDIVGGAYAMNITDMGSVIGSIWYFAPDTLKWEALGIKYSEFLYWTALGNMDDFYKSLRWRDWKQMAAGLTFNQAYMFYPFLWSKECDRDSAKKSVVPYKEILGINLEYGKKFFG
ncbi:MAG: DUF2625 domain-containing protein [Lachnospiraceae bacterium]|nr:DUF2625 domain-containing protein [Lachnospiraceae bacterium]